MKSFISEVLEDILVKNRNFSDIVFILPSKRAGSYLKKELSLISTKTDFAPKITSIEDFVKELSGLESITAVESLFYFYQAYIEVTDKKHIESFDSISSWSQTLIGDFNEIDRFLVKPKTIFSYLSSIKELNEWTLDGKQTDVVKNYLTFWNKIEHYYISFKELLLSENKGHQGLIYREAINELENYIASHQNNHHVFVGFNALNKSEEFIINELLKQDVASIYWDIDQVFTQNNYHDAGLFIRKYKSNWNIFKTTPFNWISNNYSEQKVINISGCSKQIGQIKYIASLLDSLLKNGNTLDSTAIVLGDESLLQPLLNALPKAITKLNITMGLPLKNSSLYYLFETIFKIHKDNSKQFYYKQVIEILQHPLLQDIEDFSSLIKDIQYQNITYIDKTSLIENYSFNQSSLLSLLFSSWTNEPQKAIEYILELVVIIKANLDRDKTKNKIELEFLYKFYQIFNELKTLTSSYKYINSIKILHNIFRELVSSETIDFEGDPYSGLQIMGMLESRVLDFETVLITSVNEGILPGGKTTNSFIPFEAKISNELPTYKEKDAVYTYHFYRLLQRAKNVYIIYNTEPDVLKGGEMSRFIRQLKFENIHAINHRIISTKINETESTNTKINKDSVLLEDLKSIAKKGFSPSSLTNYIRNPIDFYNQTLLNVNTFEEVEETIASNTFGNIIHKSLEELYTPFIGDYLSHDKLEALLIGINDVVKKYFREEFKKGNYDKGKNLLSFEIAKRYIQNFIEGEIKQLKEGNRIKIIALEQRLSTHIPFEEFNFPIKIKGFVDRIDVYNDTLRIIDYKTGRVDQNKVEIVNWADLTTDYDKYSKSFQVLMYAYMYHKNQSTDHPIEAGIISFKNLKKGFLKFTKKDKPGAYANKETIITTDTLEAFLSQLKLLVLEIFNPEVPFTEKQV